MAVVPVFDSSFVRSSTSGLAFSFVFSRSVTFTRPSLTSTFSVRRYRPRNSPS